MKKWLKGLLVALGGVAIVTAIWLSWKEGPVTRHPIPVPEQEPNNTFEQTGDLFANTVHTGVISSDTDVDFWMADNRYMEASHLVSLSLTDIPEGTDYDIVAYDEFATIIAKSTNMGNLSELLQFVPVPGKIYYFKVYSSTGSNPDGWYLLEVNSFY
ncbi:hypothetical protein ERICIV_01510 [Paenibacillus larvae subsp. larvae]|uniref:Uncharacterized protein n=1 Tax=Paenibacillus larvae subsp. larvae TaxID=147375 RepID=A0A2L1TYB5_9BACL|nr:hypothetical protein [Paenibacillus larvae]AQT86176.1 hypothetical protein B1222_19935 [Paenibacillus larvae subsp. pulvifaciens]AQZ47794.1 hypothetical protein B5S25_15610 [Paenibacillus larvae subsp. pulvifaciens]AVF25677.1 hypothetical protein ERICIII_01489 [Paenibacillus larvae subsp. larvae]AVF30454.1 hypothetical protein ERICIV_01510 [Paenibacillus larvae subsp. larvae]MBH0341882.1 hypothetical protein [Paenibacillus larvae]